MRGKICFSSRDCKIRSVGKARCVEELAREVQAGNACVVCWLQYHYGHSIRDAANEAASASGPSEPLRSTVTGKMQALSREARSNQRRLLTAFGQEADSELLKFNQLKVSRSEIKLPL